MNTVRVELILGLSENDYRANTYNSQSSCSPYSQVPCVYKYDQNDKQFHPFNRQDSVGVHFPIKALRYAVVNTTILDAYFFEITVTAIN